MRKRSGIRTERKRNEEDNKTDCGGEVGQIIRGEMGERKEGERKKKRRTRIRFSKPLSPVQIATCLTLLSSLFLSLFWRS